MDFQSTFNRLFVFEDIDTPRLQNLENRKYILGSEFFQVDADWGTTIAYMQIRFPLDLKNKYPKTDAYLSNLNERESFRKTQPPQA